MSLYGVDEVCATCRYAQKEESRVVGCDRNTKPNDIEGNCRSYSGPDEDCYPPTNYKWR